MQLSYANIAFYSIIYNYVGRFISAIISFFAFTYVVRSISIEDYGLLGIILNTVFFSIFLDFGIPELALRYLPEYIEKPPSLF